MRRIEWLLFVATALMVPSLVMAQSTGNVEGPPTRNAEKGSVPSQAAMDHDLLEVTIPQLERLYAAHKYTVTQVVRVVHGSHREIQRYLPCRTERRRARRSDHGGGPRMRQQGKVAAAFNAERCGVFRSLSRPTQASRA